MGKEYIERDAVFDVLFGQYCASCDETEQALNAAIEEIKSIPAADVVEVVRCGECKHWKRIRNDCILASCDLYALVRSEDFFCADGERKDGNGDV